MSLLPLDSVPLWAEDDLNKKGSAGKKGGSLSGRKAQPLHDHYGKAIGGASELSTAFQTTETSLLQHEAVFPTLEVRLAETIQFHQQQQPLVTQRYAQFDQSLAPNIGERALRGFNSAMGDLFEGVGKLVSIPLDATVGKFCRTEMGGRVCGAVAQGAVTGLESLGTLVTPVADAVMTGLREAEPTADRDRPLHAVANWSNIPPGVIREATENVISLALFASPVGRAANEGSSYFFNLLRRKPGLRGPVPIPTLATPSLGKMAANEGLFEAAEIGFKGTMLEIVPSVPMPIAPSLRKMPTNEELIEIAKIANEYRESSYFRTFFNLEGRSKASIAQTSPELWAKRTFTAHKYRQAISEAGRLFNELHQTRPIILPSSFPVSAYNFYSLCQFGSFKVPDIVSGTLLYTVDATSRQALFVIESTSRWPVLTKKIQRIVLVEKVPGVHESERMQHIASEIMRVSRGGAFATGETLLEGGQALESVFVASDYTRHSMVHALHEHFPNAIKGAGTLSQGLAARNPMAVIELNITP